MSRTLVLATLLALGGASAANAAGTSVDISSGINSNLFTYTGGDAYPSAGSTVTIDGSDGPIDFVLAPFFSFDPTGNAGVIQVGFDTSSITVDIADVTLGSNTVFYSLANSAAGAPGDVGNLTFNLTSGASIVYDYVEGNNLRDHYNGIYVNDAPNVYGTIAYDPADPTLDYDRFDAQRIEIPSFFDGDVVKSITFNSTDVTNGYPFLAALSYTNAIAAVPEPATWATMTLGVGLLGGVMRRRRAMPAAA